MPSQRTRVVCACVCVCARGVSYIVSSSELKGDELRPCHFCMPFMSAPCSQPIPTHNLRSTTCKPKHHPILFPSSHAIFFAFSSLSPVACMLRSLKLRASDIELSSHGPSLQRFPCCKAWQKSLRSQAPCVNEDKSLAVDQICPSSSVSRRMEKRSLDFLLRHRQKRRPFNIALVLEALSIKTNVPRLAGNGNSEFHCYPFIFHLSNWLKHCHQVSLH